MTDDPVKAAEARGYSKGYAAGKRRLANQDAREEMRGRRETFRQEVYLAIISQMIERPWGREVNGEHVSYTGAKEISDCAWNFAEHAVKGATFV